MSSIPEEAKQVTSSIIDELTSEIIENAEGGVGKLAALKYFVKSLPDDARAAKEAHVMIATILLAIRCREPYDLEFEFEDGDTQDDNGPFDSMPMPPLVHWSKRYWSELMVLITTLHEKLEAEPTKKLEVLCKTLRLHKTLSPIRLTLESELATKSSGTVVIEKSLVNDYFESIDGISDEGLAHDLKKLLNIKRLKKSKTSKTKVSLKPIQDLHKIMKEDNFSFHVLQLRINILMGAWVREYMGSLGRYLKKKEATPSKAATATPSSTKKRKRTSSASECAEEEEDGDEARETRPRQREEETVVKKRKCIGLGGVQILDDEDDDSDEEEDDDIVTDTGTLKRKKRRLFSVEEKNAIKKAALELGIKSWADIKYKYFDLLRQRPTKSIKACYKTMVKNGEIVEKAISSTSSDEDDTEDESHKKKVKVVKIKYSSANDRPFVRRMWTNEEKAAVRDGVYKHKPGEWAKIKEDPDFQEALSNRTPVQIKDCYRVMCKNGTINKAST